MADLPDIGSTVARRRRFAYVAMFAVLLFAYLYLRDSTWRGDIELHTLMETVATVLSLAVGCLALVRFYSKKDNTFLFIGTGFIATAFLDGYHTVISSSHFIESFPSFPPSHTTWSWFASRIFLSLLLWLSWLFWRREDRLGVAGRVSEHLVYGTVTVLALALFSIVEFVPLPTTYYQQLPIPRPQEIVPALFLLLALIGYLRKGKWKTDLFEHWLVLSLIVGFMGQAMFMSFSGRLYDMMFDAAHLLKTGSYLCALVGLLFSMQRLFSESLAQQELAFTNTILATQQEVSPDAILVVDEREKIISYNRRFVDLWGLTQEMVAARADAPVLHLVAAQVQDLAAFLARVKYLYEHRSEESHEEIDLKDGRIIDRYSTPMTGENDKYYGRIWFFRDISDRIRSERQIKLFRTLLDSALDEIQVVDPATLRIIDANESACVKLGYTRGELLALRLPDIDLSDLGTHKAISERILKDGVATFETFHKRKDGVTFPVEVTAQTVTLDRPYFLAIARDITERKRAEREVQKLQEQLREQTLHDPLTGLYNRRYFDEAMGRELIRAARNGWPAGIVMCDLDHFKVVNDTYGHLVGDEVLRVFAELLKKNSRGSDIVCRFGGEEFLLLLPDMPPEVAYQRAEQLRKALAAQQITSGATVIQVTASFGVAFFPENGKTQDALIRAADAAMYEAKKAGRDRVVVSSVRGEDVSGRTELGSVVVSK